MNTNSDIILQKPTGQVSPYPLKESLKTGDIVRPATHGQINITSQKSLIRRAHRIVKEAVSKGRIVRPFFCDKCGQFSLKLQAHHDNYLKPLNIQWMDRRCHRLLKNSPHKGNGAFCKPPSVLRLQPKRTIDEWANSLVGELKSYDLHAITKVNEVYA